MPDSDRKLSPDHMPQESSNALDSKRKATTALSQSMINFSIGHARKTLHKNQSKQLIVDDDAELNEFGSPSSFKATIDQTEENSSNKLSRFYSTVKSPYLGESKSKGNHFHIELEKLENTFSDASCIKNENVYLFDNETDMLGYLKQEILKLSERMRKEVTEKFFLIQRCKVLEEKLKDK